MRRCGTRERRARAGRPRSASRVSSVQNSATGAAAPDAKEFVWANVPEATALSEAA